MTAGIVRHHAGAIRQGGWPIVAHKILWVLMAFPSAVVLLVVWTLRPLVVVRFGLIRGDRLGHFALNTELHLCELDLDKRGQRKLDIFFHGPSIANHQLRRMWNRTLHVSRFAKWPYSLASRLPGFQAHIFSDQSDRDLRGLLERCDQHLFLTSEEENFGKEALRDLGVSDTSPFVCIHSRDSVYLDGAYPGKNWSYHDFRDSEIENFIPAAEELVRRGYFSVRTGAEQTAPLKTTNPGIIDYAANGRTEFLDIYLGAKCHFYLGDSCGFNALTMIFRRPGVIVNMVPLEHVPTWGRNYLFIPKKLWLTKENRFMTFREILDSGVGRFQQRHKYVQLEIELIENSPEEITAAAVEMDERLKGTWQTADEDEDLQRRFWSLFKPSELNGVFFTRIGAEFLRQNRKLLD